MKIVMIEGSPHKKGSSNMLAEEFKRGAEEAGHKVEILDAAHMDIHPCIGCGHCGMDGKCVYKDDNKLIKKALLKADMAVFVTPIYYYGITAQLKTVIDRFYCYNKKLSEAHIKTVLITAAWNDDDDTMPCTAAYYQKLCRCLNFSDCGMILGTGCGTPKLTKDSPHMKEAYDLGKSL